jgi:flavin-dependent dehydrogenase
MAACQLARLGHSVLIIDKSVFPRDKVCGGCLSAASLKTLADARMSLPPHAYGLTLATLCLAARGAQADLPMPTGLAVPRNIFDSHLLRLATDAGAAFLPRACAVSTREESEHRSATVQYENETVQINARIVLAAEGLQGKLLRDDPTLRVAPNGLFGAATTFTHCSAPYRRATIYMACSTEGYVGVVRYANGDLHVGVALDSTVTRQEGGLGALSARILADSALPAIDGLHEVAWKGTPPLTRSLGRLAARRLMVVGDAAGYVEPFTGEGMAWALAGGRAVTPLAARAIEQWSDDLIRQWTITHDRLVRRRQWLCGIVGKLVRRPRLVGPAVKILRHLPGLSRPVMRIVSWPYRTQHPSLPGAS